MLVKAGTLNLMEEEKMPPRRKKNKAVLPKEKMAYFMEFLENTLTDGFIKEIDTERLVEFGEQLYMLPEGCPDLSEIHILRAGLHLGEFKKNRFEPSHSLALTLSKEDVNNYINLPVDDDRVCPYFNGMGIAVDSADDYRGKKGWCLVCIDGYSAGWGKIAGAMIKNHYPKGLRKDLK